MSLNPYKKIKQAVNKLEDGYKAVWAIANKNKQELEDLKKTIQELFEIYEELKPYLPEDKRTNAEVISREEN